MTLVSVIIPTYNIKNELPRCLDSLIAQTYTELEIIVVNDGSTDGTDKVCDEYAKLDERICIVHKENGGVSSARNAALKVAHGEYVACVDGDDYVEPDMIETMVSAALKYEAPLACCGYHQHGKGAEHKVYSKKVTCLDRAEALLAYVTDDERTRIYNSVWSKLFKRELLEGMVFPEGRESEDIFYTTWALINAEKVAHVDRALYHYVLDRDGSIMNSKERLAQRRFEDEIPITHEQSRAFKNAGFADIADRNEYKLSRKELFYYLDFKKKGMKEAAKKLHKMMKSQKAELFELYESGFVKTGDRVRLKLFLAFPRLYYYIVKLYDGVIVPIRLR